MVLIRPAEYRDGFDAFVEVSGLFESLVLILPGSKLLIFYERFQLLDCDCILLHGGCLDRVVDKVKPLDFFSELFQSKDD